MKKRNKNQLFPGTISILDAIPCYGTHGDINTPEGLKSRLQCERCREFMKEKTYEAVE